MGWGLGVPGARVPGVMLWEAGTGRWKFRDTLHEADKIDEMHDADTDEGGNTTPRSRAWHGGSGGAGPPAAVCTMLTGVRVVANFTA